MKTNDLVLFCKKAKKVKPSKKIPITNYVLLKDGKLSITNDKISVVQSIKGLEEFEDCLIPFVELDGIVSKIKDADIYFTSIVETYIENNKEQKVFKVKIDTNKGSFTLNSMDSNDYIAIENCDIDIDWLDVSDLDMIKLQANYKFNDELRPHISGVYLDEEFIVSTDAHIMHWESRENEHKTKLLIPNEALSLLDSFHNVIIRKKTVLEKTSHYCIFDTVNDMEYVFINILSDSGYVNYKCVIPANYTSEFKIDRKQLIGIAELSKQSTGSETIIFELDVDNKKLSFHSENLDTSSEYHTTEKVQCNGDDIRIGFGVKKLLTILKIEKDVDFHFKLSGSRRAAIINDKIVLMPVLIQG